MTPDAENDVVGRQDDGRLVVRCKACGETFPLGIVVHGNSSTSISNMTTSCPHCQERASYSLTWPREQEPRETTPREAIVGAFEEAWGTTGRYGVEPDEHEWVADLVLRHLAGSRAVVVSATDLWLLLRDWGGRWGDEGLDEALDNIQAAFKAATGKEWTQIRTLPIGEG